MNASSDNVRAALGSSGAEAEFRDAMVAAGLQPPAIIEADGNIHRFPGDDGPGDDSCWYVLHADAVSAAAFGDWRTGLSKTWFEKNGRKLSPREAAARRDLITVARRKAKVEGEQRKADAAHTADSIWSALAVADDSHAYLASKGVRAHGVRIDGSRLVIPMRDVNGTLRSLQYIAKNGTKRYLPGGRTKGCYFIIGEPGDRICIAEGYATGASVHEATGYGVAVAFDAGNLEPVARALRAKYPDLQITICADDDYRTSGNPGLTRAGEAASAVNGLVAIPEFGAERPDGATDFNDLFQHRGAEGVRRAIANARAPAVGGHPRAETNPAATDSASAQSSLAAADLDAASQITPSSSEVQASSLDQLIPNLPDGESESLLDAVGRLAAMHPLEYDRVRVTEAERLGVRVGILDNAVSIARRTQREEGGKPAMFPTVTPWPDPVSGAELLSDLLDIVQRFIVCERETAVAAALWIAFTWLVDRVQVAPLAVITAPEKRCGKTLLLNLLGKLSRRPLVASNISPAATFRVIEAHGPTLLIDEADAFLRENEELRSVINSGHTRQAAYVIRTVGDDHEPRQFSTWGAKAIAGIGTLAETIMDRAILLELRRKLPSESVARLRHAEAGLFDRLASMLARFAEDAGPTIERSRPHLPGELNDRAQDNWEPLLAIADHAGGDWPQLARATALKLSGVNEASVSLSAELLTDIRDVFETKRVDRISTAELLQALTADDLNPWATYSRGKPMSARQLAKRLEEYRVSSKNIKVAYGEVKKGFLRSQFDDAFARYLTLPTEATATAATPLPSGENQAATRGYRVAELEPGSATDPTPATSRPAPVLERSVVANKSRVADEYMVEVQP